MFESLVEWKNGTVSTDIHLQAEISGSMPRVVLRESNKNKLITIFCKKSKIRLGSKNQSKNWSEICEKYFLWFPQKIYKLRQLSLSQFVYFLGKCVYFSMFE